MNGKEYSTINPWEILGRTETRSISPRAKDVDKISKLKARLEERRVPQPASYVTYESFAEQLQSFERRVRASRHPQARAMQELLRLRDRIEDGVLGDMIQDPDAPHALFFARMVGAAATHSEAA